jgi:hypothetical protein
LYTGMKLADWPYEPLFAPCYLGSVAIPKELQAGAVIMVCGRVADAAYIMEAAMWWHGGSSDQYDQSAQTLIAQHLMSARHM